MNDVLVRTKDLTFDEIIFIQSCIMRSTSRYPLKLMTLINKTNRLLISNDMYVPMYTIMNILKGLVNQGKLFETSPKIISTSLPIGHIFPTSSRYRIFNPVTQTMVRSPTHGMFKEYIYTRSLPS